MLKRPAMLFAALLLAAVLVAGLARLFELRLGQGDIYPPYSSLRTDPLGASVLYESLGEIPGVAARRWYEPELKDDTGRDRALLVLGAQPWSTRWLGRSEFEVLQRYVQDGGRVVIAYYPDVRETWTSRVTSTNELESPFFKKNQGGKKAPRRPFRKNSTDDEDEPVTNSAPLTNLVATKTATNLLTATNALVYSNAVTSAGSTNAAATNGFKPIKLKSPEELLPTRRSRDLRKREEQEDRADFERQMRRNANLAKEWGFEHAYENLGTNADEQIEFPLARRVGGPGNLPELLPIHTALYFKDLTNGWTTVYERQLTPKKKVPVVIERRVGAGSIVLVADSYPFSNEAMFKDRQAALLSWLLAGGREVTFEEAHLGVVSTDGVASLMRKYRLHGLIGGLLLVAALFVWKNSRSLVPPYDDTAGFGGALVLGKDSATGFVNLLRRGIAPAEILNVCIAEWNKSNARRTALSPAQQRELNAVIQQQAALEPSARQPVATYRAISEILNRRRTPVPKTNPSTLSPAAPTAPQSVQPPL